MGLANRGTGPLKAAGCGLRAAGWPGLAWVVLERACVCVCVCESEREREREKGGGERWYARGLLGRRRGHVHIMPMCRAEPA